MARLKWIVGALALAGCVLPAQGQGWGNDRAPAAGGVAARGPVVDEVQLIGNVEVSVQDAGGNTRTFGVPGIQVTLISAGARGVVEAGPLTGVTDDRGRFEVDAPPGRYLVCWSGPGFAGGCLPKAMDILDDTVYLPDPIALSPLPGIVFGRARLMDGTAAYYSDTAFGVETAPTVELLDFGGRQLTSVITTPEGEFIISNVPAGDYLLRTTVAGVQTQVPIVIGPAPVLNDPMLPNTQPRVVTVLATQGGGPVRYVLPGATVTLTVDATDADGDLLQYQWLTPNTGGTLNGANAPTITWTLPAVENAVSTAFVLVTDGKAGYAVGRVDLNTSSSGTPVLFTGTVVNGVGAPVPGATVAIGSTPTVTNGDGFFMIETAPAPTYSLTISADGFLTVCKVLQAESVGLRYVLTSASSTPYNPGGPGMRVFEVGQGRPRAYIDIPPGTLGGPGGLPPPNELIVCITTVDLASPDGLLVGNFSALTAQGDDVTLQPLGAVEVRIKDLAGNQYSILPGQSITVSIPIQAVPPASAPQQAPLWVFDESNCRWREHAPSQRTGGYYVGTVTKLGVIVAATGVQNLACLRLQIDVTKVQGRAVGARVTVPAANGAPPKIIIKQIDPGTGHALVERLPTNTVVRVDITDLNGSLIRDVPPIMVNTGGAVPPNGEPPSPFNECTKVDLPLSTPPDPAVKFLSCVKDNGEVDAQAYYAAIDPAVTAAPGGSVGSAGKIVTGQGTTFTTFFRPGDLIRVPATPQGGQPAGEARVITKVVNDTRLEVWTKFAADLPAGSTYEKVGGRGNLEAWKTANGFGAPDAQVSYSNDLDLGFGRKMFMKRNNGEIAYYVQNYPSTDEACLDKKLLATVAMEYRRINGAGPITTFYIFDNTGARIPGIDLDKGGVKHVPSLCIVCHAGKKRALVGNVYPNNGDTNARFIPFALDSYGFSGVNAACSKAGQQPGFKELNKSVIQDTNKTNAVDEMVKGWYGGANLPAATEDEKFAPPSFDNTPVCNGCPTRKQVYLELIRPSCRACHTTRDAIAFNNWENFKDDYGGSIQRRVCTVRDMPGARLTWLYFWLSKPSTEVGSSGVTQPELLKKALEIEDCPAAP